MSTVVAVRTSSSVSADMTRIEHDEFPAVYVDHARNWIEIGDLRFAADTSFAGGYEASPADVVAWLRAVADAIEECAAEAEVQA